MIVLLGVIFLAGISLAAYGLFSQREIKDTRVHQSYPTDQKLRLQEQIASLESELGKIKVDYADIQKQLVAAKEKEAEFKEELGRKQDWVNKSDESLKKVEARSLELEKQFFQKEKELQEEFSKNVDLNRKLTEAKERIETLEKENKEKSDQIEALKHKVEGYIQEAKKHADAFLELKKKEEISEWVPKIEFNRLNEEYVKLEKEFQEKNEKIKKLGEEIIYLNSQLKEKEQSEGES